METLAPIFDGRSVSVYSWSPPAKYNYTNFGDEIGPLLVSRLLELAGFGEIELNKSNSRRRNKLITVGSVLHQAIDGDVIWGAGINGKNWPRNLETVKELYISSVRGPLTRNALLKFGFDCPSVFGDPGLIFPSIFKREIDHTSATMKASEFSEILFIPNLNDDRFLDPQDFKHLDSIKYVSPRLKPFKIAALISKATLVLSSSLHGIVFADSYSTPVIPLLSYFEPIYKYIDYFEGTGRTDVRMASSLSEAIDYPAIAPAEYDSAQIQLAFPLKQIGLTK